MKNRANKEGYIKVSDTLMVNELLNSIHKPKLLKCHIDELQKINIRLDRSNYISKPQRDYLTKLYIGVVLNNESFNIIKDTPKIIIGTPQHIGMQLYHAINSAKCNASN